MINTSILNGNIPIKINDEVFGVFNTNGAQQQEYLQTDPSVNTKENTRVRTQNLIQDNQTQVTKSIT